MNSVSLKNDIYRKSTSITYRHILSIINTLIAQELHFKNLMQVTILDAGCGNGELILFLTKYLPDFHQNVSFRVFGYDVVDHGVQPADYANKATVKYKNLFPHIDWNERIKFISSNEPWPFENQSFDIVVSNQVLEHVWDHNHFFAEQSRVLKDKGLGIHLFPVREVFYDGHIFLPYVHRLKSWDSIYTHVKMLSRIGLGSYRKHKKRYNNDLDFFSRVWADKLYHYCNYKSYREIAEHAKNNNLCITSRFTFSLYKRKLMETLGRRVGFHYKNKTSSGFLFFFLKRISGICLVLFKGEYSTYSTERPFTTNEF